MKDILVVFTGGTIGSKTHGTAIDVHADAGYELLQRYKEQYGERAVFTTVQPFAVLSENMLPSDWELLCKTIEQHDPARYAGIIITHGTDTLAYTAAAVSYRFAGTAVPILITASNFPLDDPRSEGVRNFAACVEMIASDPLPGIFVVFEDQDARMLVHLGTRIRQSQPFTDQFVSIYDEPFGEIIDGRLALNKHGLNPGTAQLQAVDQRTSFSAGCSFAADILHIKPYPGFRYSYIQLRHLKPQAVLLELYHSGTTAVRSASEGESLESFIRLCKQEDIPVYIAPVKTTSDNRYATAHEVLRYGAIPLPDVSVEAALVKLMLAYGSLTDQQEIDRLLERNLFFEMASRDMSKPL